MKSQEKFAIYFNLMQSQNKAHWIFKIFSLKAKICSWTRFQVYLQCVGSSECRTPGSEKWLGSWTNEVAAPPCILTNGGQAAGHQQGATDHQAGWEDRAGAGALVSAVVSWPPALTCPPLQNPHTRTRLTLSPHQDQNQSLCRHNIETRSSFLYFRAQFKNKQVDPGLQGLEWQPS